MHNNPSPADVQQDGCWTWVNIAYHLDNNKEAVGRIKAVITSMHKHSSYVDVQLEGCSALMNVAINSDNNLMAVARAGRIEAVITAMHNNPSHAGVQLKGCKALQNIASKQGQVGLKQSLQPCTTIPPTQMCSTTDAGPWCS